MYIPQPKVERVCVCVCVVINLIFNFFNNYFVIKKGILLLIPLSILVVVNHWVFQLHSEAILLLFSYQLMLQVW